MRGEDAWSLLLPDPKTHRKVEALSIAISEEDVGASDPGAAAAAGAGSLPTAYHALWQILCEVSKRQADWLAGKPAG